MSKHVPSTKRGALIEAARAAENELQEIIEWALVEKAPLRQQEIDSIRAVRNKLRRALPKVKK